MFQLFFVRFQAKFKEKGSELASDQLEQVCGWYNIVLEGFQGNVSWFMEQF